jgi:amino acid permease
MIAYLIFIGSQLDQVICFETQLEFCEHKPLYIMFAVIVLVPICWLRDMKYLGYVSFVANFFLLFSCKLFFLLTIEVVVISWYCFRNI